MDPTSFNPLDGVGVLMPVLCLRVHFSDIERNAQILTPFCKHAGKRANHAKTVPIRAVYHPELPIFDPGLTLYRFGTYQNRPARACDKNPGPPTRESSSNSPLFDPERRLAEKS